MKERVIPHNLEAEQSVLGSMFLSKYAAQKCVENLEKDLFYSDNHKKIFEVMSDLLEKQIPIDFTTVSAELDKRKWLKQVGDVEYLSELTNIVPSAANVDNYIQIVEENAILRRLIEESTEIANDCFGATGDISELLDNAEKKILNVVKTRKGTEFRSLSDVLNKTQLDLEKLSKNKGEITGIATGFYDLDKITSGFHENELIILAARPAMGKTAFALNLAMNMADNTDKAVAIFNLEMGAEQLAMRMIASAGQIDSRKLRTGRLDHQDWKRVNEAMSRLANKNIFIDDTPGLSISYIRAKCRRLSASDSGLSAVIIDYLQLINGSSKYAGQRQQEVSEISRSLKTMAMELNIPVIALAQLSRSVESRDDKRPILSDLRESGSIEQDADLVAFLYRDDYYNKENAIDENTSRSELLIRKNRSGPTATVDLIFKLQTSTFLNFINREEN